MCSELDAVWRETDRYTDRQTDTQTETDRQTDRQADSLGAQCHRFANMIY